MVKIRLTRIGRTHGAFFRIVVADERRARDGRVIEYIGRYQPVAKENQVLIEQERALYWLSQGAQPTDTVRAIFRNAGLLQKHHESKVAARKALEASRPPKEKKAGK